MGKVGREVPAVLDGPGRLAQTKRFLAPMYVSLSEKTWRQLVTPEGIEVDESAAANLE